MPPHLIRFPTVDASNKPLENKEQPSCMMSQKREVGLSSRTVEPRATIISDGKPSESSKSRLLEMECKEVCFPPLEAVKYSEDVNVLSEGKHVANETTSSLIKITGVGWRCCNQR